MAKLLALFLAVAALLGVGYFYVMGEAKGRAADAAREASAPKQQLDNFRDKAREIEKDTQRRADEMFKKGE